MASRSIKLPEIPQAKTYLVTFVLGIMIAFMIWGLSYIGWFRFGTPVNSFPVRHVNSDKAVTLETLLQEHQFIQPQGMKSSDDVDLDITVDYWDKLFYPKDLFLVRTSVTNNYGHTLWYPTILVLVMDSRDYVRGKTIIELWGEDNAIENEQTVVYSFHFKVPEDMQGDNVFIRAFLYGEFSYEYPYHGNVGDILPTTEDDVYGRLPYDSDRDRFLSSISGKFKTYPPFANYVFQVVSVIGTFVSVFLFTLSFMAILGEKLRKFLGTDRGFVFIMMVLMIILLFVVFLVSLFFY